MHDLTMEEVCVVGKFELECE